MLVAPLAFEAPLLKSVVPILKHYNTQVRVLINLVHCPHLIMRILPVPLYVQVSCKNPYPLYTLPEPGRALGAEQTIHDGQSQGAAGQQMDESQIYSAVTQAIC